MKRYRGETAQHTRWRRANGLDWRNQRKRGARQKRIDARIAAALKRISQATGLPAHVIWNRDEHTGKPFRLPTRLKKGKAS